VTHGSTSGACWVPTLWNNARHCLLSYKCSALYTEPNFSASCPFRRNRKARSVHVALPTCVAPQPVTTAVAPADVSCPCVGSATALCVAPRISGGNICKPRPDESAQRVRPILPPERSIGFPQALTQSSRSIAVPKHIYIGEKRMVARFAKKFPILCGNRKSIAALTTASLAPVLGDTSQRLPANKMSVFFWYLPNYMRIPYPYHAYYTPRPSRHPNGAYNTLSPREVCSSQ
jgi:hypothetical protein